MSYKYKTIFLDRDGTINSDPGYINKLEDFNFYHYTLEALRIFDSMGCNFCIVTNQSGVARGIIRIDELKEINKYIINFFKDNNFNLLDIYYCTDHPNEPSIFRKPNTGMLEKAAREYKINLVSSLFIGDYISDIEAGNRMGIDTMLVLSGRGREAVKSKKIKPTYVVENILRGAELTIELKE